MRKTGDWNKMIDMMGAMEHRCLKSSQREFGRVAEKVKTSMITGITSKRFKLEENKTSTIKRKGSSTPLVDDGDLIGSIKTHKVSARLFLVGAHKDAVDKDGKSVANIFAVNTYGVDKVAKSGKRIRIPARDAISPALKENEDEFKKAGKEVLKKTFEM